MTQVENYFKYFILVHWKVTKLENVQTQLITRDMKVNLLGGELKQNRFPTDITDNFCLQHNGKKETGEACIMI